MSDYIIKVETLGKKYKIRHQQPERYTALRDIIAHKATAPLRWLRDQTSAFKSQRSASTNGNGAYANCVDANPQLANGNGQIALPSAEADIRSLPSDFRPPTSEEFWALKDVSFEVKQGAVVGIIGRNGAGKSTLLKILSRITKPTEGRVHIRGRVASLLEVGTGFHPELTGRENIFLNGAVLGMNREEIRKKFDEIVAFAEAEKFLDTPVKRYSSGMYVRLAFAVAAHLEPEILIVDEVLAVGDAEFQKKCLGKMGQVAHGGRTVLFVSHNLGAVSSLCDSSILIDHGHLMYVGSVESAIRQYLSARKVSNDRPLSASFTGPLANAIEVVELTVNGQPSSVDLQFSPSTELVIKLRAISKRPFNRFRTTFSVYCENIRLFTVHDMAAPQPLKPGRFESSVRIPAFFLRPGEYSLAVGGHSHLQTGWFWGTELLDFKIVEEFGPGYEAFDFGFVNLPNVHGCRKEYCNREPS